MPLLPVLWMKNRIESTIYSGNMSSNWHVKEKEKTCSHIPVSPTANTKGNKRSRTRTDSYTAGQSVGESTVQLWP